MIGRTLVCSGFLYGYYRFATELTAVVAEYGQFSSLLGNLRTVPSASIRGVFEYEGTDPGSRYRYSVKDGAQVMVPTAWVGSASAGCSFSAMMRTG
jgi:hypothetical protein